MSSLFFVREKHLTEWIFLCILVDGKGKTLYRGGKINMERIVKHALLYDFYGQLLTKHQKEIYSDYIQDDLSPSEIALNHGITRQAAYDMIRRCNKILEGYEENLHLLEKFLKTKDMVLKINYCAKTIIEQEKSPEVVERLKEIENISNAILEEY